MKYSSELGGEGGGFLLEGKAVARLLTVHMPFRGGDVSSFQHASLLAPGPGLAVCLDKKLGVLSSINGQQTLTQRLK